MNALPLKRFFPSLIAFVLFVCLTALTGPGCGQSTEDTDPSTLTNKDLLDDPANPWSGSLERWETLPELLVSGQTVTYTIPSGMEPPPQNNAGATSPLNVGFTLVAEDAQPVSIGLTNGVFYASGSMTMGSGLSITGNPMKLRFTRIPVWITESEIVLNSFQSQNLGFESTCTMNTQLASGADVKAPFDFHMDITQSSTDKYTCHCVFIVNELNFQAEFSVEIHRTGGDNIISFQEKTWSEKVPTVNMLYPRKQYNKHETVSAVPAGDLLELTIAPSNEPENYHQASGAIHLPAELSPNGTPIELDFSDVAVLSDVTRSIYLRFSKNIDTVDLEGQPLNTDCYGMITVKKTIFFEIDPESDPENPTHRQVAQYTCTASIDWDRLNQRSSLTETLTRTDVERTDVVTDMGNARFVLASGSEYSLTHAAARTEAVDDLVTPVYIQDEIPITPGMLGIMVTVDQTGTAGGYVAIPEEISPPRFPKMLVLFPEGTTATVLEEQTRINGPVFIQKSYTVDLAGTTMDIMENGTMDLVFQPSDKVMGTYVCNMNLVSIDGQTRFEVSGVPVEKSDIAVPQPATEWTQAETAQFNVNCGLATARLIDEKDLDLAVTLHKRLTPEMYFISADVNVNIKPVSGCLAQDLSIRQSDLPVEIDETGPGFVIYYDEATPGLIVSAYKKDSDGYEMQIDIVREENTLQMTLPVEITGGDGVFLQPPQIEEETSE